MSTPVLLPKNWNCPEGYTLMSDFSGGKGQPATHTLTRNRDHAMIHVDFQEGATPPENLNELFPKKNLTEATDPAIYN